MKSSYNAFVFDLDGTLAESKSALSREVADFVCALLRNGKQVGVISGGWFPQFETQFLAHIQCTELFSRLYLLPTSGAVMFVFENGSWAKRYAHEIPYIEYEQVVEAFDTAFTHTSFERPVAKWGAQIEYRETQITFSALGQEAPSAEKKAWDPDKKKKLEIVHLVQALLPKGLVARAGGTTSIDITREGIDKGFGLEQFWKETGRTVDDTLFVGDALYEGGNDYAVVRTRVDTLSVDGPEDVLHMFTQNKFV